MCPTCLDRGKKNRTLFCDFNWLSGLVLKEVCTLAQTSNNTFLCQDSMTYSAPSIPTKLTALWPSSSCHTSKTFTRFGSSCCLFPFFLIKMIMPSHRAWFAALDVILKVLKFFCCVVLPYLKNANRNSVLKWTALLQNLWSLPAISVKS